MYVIQQTECIFTVYDAAGKRVYGNPSPKETSRQCRIPVLGVPYTVTASGEAPKTAPDILSLLAYFTDRYSLRKEVVTFQVMSGFVEKLLEKQKIFRPFCADFREASVAPLCFTPTSFCTVLSLLARTLTTVSQKIRPFSYTEEDSLILGFSVPLSSPAEKRQSLPNDVANRLSLPPFLCRYMLQAAIAGGFDLTFTAEDREAYLSVVLPFYKARTYTLYQEPPFPVPPFGERYRDPLLLARLFCDLMIPLKVMARTSAVV